MLQTVDSPRFRIAESRILAAVIVGIPAGIYFGFAAFMFNNYQFMPIVGSRLLTFGIAAAGGFITYATVTTLQAALRTTLVVIVVGIVCAGAVNAIPVFLMPVPDDLFGVMLFDFFFRGVLESTVPLLAFIAGLCLGATHDGLL